MSPLVCQFFLIDGRRSRKSRTTTSSSADERRMAGVTEADSLGRGADQIHIPCARLYRSQLATVSTINFGPSTNGVRYNEMVQSDQALIQPQGGGEDVLVHISAIESGGLRTLNEKDRGSLLSDPRGQVSDSRVLGDRCGGATDRPRWPARTRRNLGPTV